MHVEITRTSRRFHLPPDIAQVFIEAGLATEVPKAAPPALPTYWEYFCGPTRFGAIAVQRKKGAYAEILAVEPEDIKRHWPDCPDSVIAQYQATPVPNRIML